MTKIGVHRAYTGRTLGVVTLCTAVLASGGAQAGAWEEFERRCLVPMAEFSEPDLTSLTVTKKIDPKVDPDIEITFGHYPADDPMRLDAFYMLINFDQGSVDECYLIFRSGYDEQLTETARAGLSENQRPFVRRTNEDQLEIWDSDLWREPVLSVAFGKVPSVGSYALLARETDLES
jgi:hypothetical protein